MPSRSVLVSVSVLALSSLVSCTSTSDDGPTERASSAIVNGAASATDGVGLVYFSDDYVCSGFLASPNVVVTAAFCFNGGRTPIAFYTGPGTAVTATNQVPTAADLTKHAVKSFGKHPQAAPQPGETGAASYTAKNDVAYVVLKDASAGKPLAYGTAASAGSCTALGYGRTGNVFQQGSLGVRRQGTVSINGTLPNSSALNVSGSNLANSGDFGGPLVCADNVAAIFSAYHYNAQNVIDINAYQPISGAIKIYLDDIVAANAVAAAPDAGPDADTDDASTSSGDETSKAPTKETPAASSDASAASSSSRASLEEPAAHSGCSIERRAPTSSAWLLGIAAVVAARARRRWRR